MAGGAEGAFFLSSLRRASWLKISDSVVLARLVGDEEVVAGAEVWAGAGGAAAGAAGVGSTVAGAVGGADGARTGFVELGLLVHASSSNPLAELDRGGACTGLSKDGDEVRTPPVRELRSTEGGKLLLGFGRPRRGALRAPPGPCANRLGAGLEADPFNSAWSSFANSSSFFN